MAIDTLNIKKYNSQDADKLASVLNGVIDNIQTSAVSEILKNKNGSGSPEAGTIEYKRFVNATLRNKGTARAAGKGDKVEAQPVFVNLSDNKEIVEEIALKDLKLYGVAGMAEKRATNFANRVKAYLDKQFFAEAVAEGTKFTRNSLTDAKDIIDGMIVNAKSVSSSFIDGIDAGDLALVLGPSYRKALKNDLDALPNGTVASNGLIGAYDGVDVYESTRLPNGIEAVIMLKGAIAQPYFVSEYNLEKIPLDDNYALSTFLYTGVEALADEAIIYDGTQASL